jgi:lysozyme family protein
MSRAFLRAFEILIGHEGGYVNHPNDPGGETKFGISKRAYPQLAIADLTLERARDIYARDYWEPIKGDRLPPDLALLVFDAAVNNGVGQAARWLQRTVGVKQDGNIGPRTLEAVRQTADVARRFHTTRVEMMTGLATWSSFGRGWARRLALLPFEAQQMVGGS